MKTKFFLNFICLFLILAIGLLACGENKTTTSSTTIAGDTTNENTTSGSTTIVGDTTNENTSIVETTQNQTTTEVVLCDHTKLHHTSINLADYGMCPGEVYFDICDCGEKVYIPGYLFEPGCTSDTSYDDEYYTDENGVEWTKHILVCDECKATITMNYTEIVEGCLRRSVAYISIVKDGNVIFDNAYGEYVYKDHDVHTEEMDLSKYGVCGNALMVNKCLDCGEIVYFGNLACAIERPNMEETEPETFVDENGFTHQVYKIQCPDCGLIEAIELWDDPYSQCVGKRTLSVSLSKGDTVILSISNSGYYFEHEFEYSYELEGDNCEDGYLKNALCKTCGFIYSSKEDWHDYEELEIDLSEYEVCGNSSIYYDYCNICNKVLYFNDEECASNCSTPEIITNYTKDGIEHTVYDYLCSECGLKITYDTWEETSECLTKNNSNIIVSINDNIIFNNTIVQRDYHHNYTEEYELRGEVCTDGYRIIRTCSVCGDVEYSIGNGHDFNQYQIDMNEEYGACDCTIYVSECERCHSKSMTYHCYCEMGEPVTTTNTDDNGIVHTINTSSCANCSLVIVEENWVVEGENCLQTKYEKTSIYYDGNLVEQAETSYSDSAHDYKFSYEMTGTTCDDGYFIHITCSKCDYSNTKYASGHDYLQQTIQLGDLECCDGFIRYNECKVCGKNTAIYDELSCNFTETTEDYTDNGVDHSVIVKTCPDCGFKHITERYMITKEICEITNYQIDTYLLGGQELASYTDQRDGYNHEYERSYQIEEGKTCNEGYTVIDTCAKCGDIKTYQSKEHIKETNVIDLGELGCCGCVITEKRCTICDKVTYLDYTCDCQTNLVTTTEPDEEGIEHTIYTYTCNSSNPCKLVIVRNNWDVYVSECQHYAYSSVKIYYDNVLYAERTQESFVTQHTSEKTYELKGISCDQGYTVISKCKYCGVITETSEGTQHKFEAFEEIDLSKYEGCCGGSIKVELCTICRGFLMNLKSCNCLLADGGSTEVDGHTFSTMACSKCNFKIVYEFWQETNEDNIVTNHSVVYFYNKDGIVYQIQS